MSNEPTIKTSSGERGQVFAMGERGTGRAVSKAEQDKRRAFEKMLSAWRELHRDIDKYTPTERVDMNKWLLDELVPWLGKTPGKIKGPELDSAIAGLDANGALTTYRNLEIAIDRLWSGPAPTKGAREAKKTERAVAYVDNILEFRSSDPEPEPWPEVIDFAALFENKPEEPKFIIPDWLPTGLATLFGGHGDAGKSTIALKPCRVSCARQRLLWTENRVPQESALRVL